jgi:putative oxidoreductase
MKVTHMHKLTNSGETLVSRTYLRLVSILDRTPNSLTQILLRWGLAGVFWTSARTKVEGVMTVSDGTKYLFAEEYRVPLLNPDLAAYAATYAEHAFALSLFVGLATRLSAVGVIGMTLVIQLFVYPDAFVGVHLGWFAMAVAILAWGPGAISVDHLLRQRFIR